MSERTALAVRTAGLARTFEVGETTVEALRGIDLKIEKGEFVALVGPSGSGKSTFLNLVGGLDRPTAGELWVGGMELSASKEKALTEHRRRRVGFVFQSFNLLPRLTALENVALPLMFVGVPERERRDRARDLLVRVGLEGRLEHRPTQLSGGEQQRVAIARALVGRPAIILADEPTGNIDSATGAEIMALLRHLNRDQGVTLLLVTHDPDAAAFADRVIHLRDGQIVPPGGGEPLVGEAAAGASDTGLPPAVGMEGQP
jgi:putative ABC transport system ATP-binding protein